MKRTLVIYKSKYGATQAYARMISEALGCDRIMVDQMKLFSQFGEYENIVLCLPIYNGLLAGINTVKARYYRISEKNITLFMVGLTDLASEAEIDRTVVASLTEGMQHKFRIFYAKGRMTYRSLMPLDKLAWNKWIKYLRKKPEQKLNETEMEMLNHSRDKLDYIEEASIQSLIKYIRSLS